MKRCSLFVLSKRVNVVASKSRRRYRESGQDYGGHFSGVYPICDSKADLGLFVG